MFVREKQRQQRYSAHCLRASGCAWDQALLSSGQEKKKPGGCPPGSISIAND